MFDGAMPASWRGPNDYRHLNQNTDKSEKVCAMLYASQEEAVMYEYFKGDFFRCRRMVDCALANDRLPARSRDMYTRMLRELDAKEAESEAAMAGKGSRIAEMATYYQYTLQAIPEDEPKGAVDEKQDSLSKVIEQTKTATVVSDADNLELFNRLVKVFKSSQKSSNRDDGKKDSLDVRRVGHLRTSSMY